MCPQTSLLSAFRYYEKPSRLHCEPHTDKGLLSIVLNPRDLEVLVDGVWTRAHLDKQGNALPSNYAVVLVGHTLEVATNGRFKAALHRIVNSGGARDSIVAKIRADADTVLDLPHSPRRMRRVCTPDETITPVRVGDALQHLEQHTSSVNELRPVPPRQITATLSAPLLEARTGFFASLPAELIVLVAAHFGVADLARAAQVSTWMRALATHDRFWVALAVRADIDWTSFVVSGPHSLHTELGPQLLHWETNPLIALYLTADPSVFTMAADGAPPSEEAMVASLAATYHEEGQIRTTMRVTTRLRTPLSTVVDDFVDALHAHDKRFHVEEFRGDDKDDSSDDNHPFVAKSYIANQGLVCNAGFPVHRAQRINPHLAAWHYGLQPECVLTFTQQDVLVD